MLTPKQAEMLQTIESLTVNGVAPTVRELTVAAGLHSTSGIHRLLVGMEDRGYIRRMPGKWRAIEILRRVDGAETDAGVIAQLRARIAELEGQNDR